jgi:Ca2+-binding RTX toxin-like protein
VDGDSLAFVPTTYNGTYGDLTISQNADGTYRWSYTLTDPVDNDSDANPSGSFGSETITVMVSDGHGGMATVDLTINIGDDAPSIQSIQNGMVDNEADLSITGSITATPGADGIVLYQLDPGAITQPTGLTYFYSANNTQLLAKDGTGEDVFTLKVNTNGTYDFTLLKPAPESVVVTPPFDTLDVPNHADSYTIDLYTSYDAGGTGIGDPIGTVTFRVENAATQDLSVSNDGLGINNNLMNVGEKLFMDFDSAASDATFNIGNFSTGDVMVWKVYDQNGNQLDSGTITNSFYAENGTLVSLTSSESPNYLINLSANGLDPDTYFYSMSIESTTNSFKFTGFSVEKALTVLDQEYDFSVVATDADGDVSANSGFTVTVDGTGNILTGSSLSDVINAGAGNDIIDGGLGSDTLTGGAGADTFKIGYGDDVIKDFTVGTDKLFIDVSHTDEVLLFNPSTNSTSLAIKDGAATVATVTLEGGDFSSVPLNTLIPDDPNHTP